MNPKIELTKYVLETLNLNYTTKTLRKYMHLWWWNTRNKNTGGWRLTEEGFFHLNGPIKSYEIKFDDPVFFTNELIIWIDQNINCPFYINNKRIWVFCEKMAVQIVLFSGDIQKLHRAKKRSKEQEKFLT